MKPTLPDIRRAGAKVKRSLMALNTTLVRRRIWHFFILALVAALSFWFWGLLESSGLPEQATELIRSTSRANRLLAYGLFTGLAMVSVLLGPFTSTPVVPVALLLWGKWVTFGLLMVGWMLGGIGAYAVGKHFGYPVVSKIVSPQRVNAWRNLFARRVTFVWALLFRLAMPAETGYIFGLVKYHFRKFLAATFLVEVATGAVLISGGNALLQRDIVQFAAWIAGGIIIFAGAAYLLRKKLQAS